MSDFTTNSRYRLSLGRIAPAVVLICFLLDVSLRFMPVRLFAFRGWEGLSVYATGNSPFVRNGFYWNPRSYGDLANIGNLPHLRQYREDVFTTDAEGYRNRVEVAKPFNGILLLGDSFAAGASVRDNETLSEQISRVSGCPVFNGAASPDFLKLLSELQMTHGLVIWEQSERNRIPQLPLVNTPSPGWKYRAMSSVLGAEHAELLQRMENYSPLQSMFGRAVKLIQNNEILPNPNRGVVEAQLRNGQEMLFLQSELNNYESDRPSDPAFFVALKTELQKEGIGLLVLLVPDKYVVYRDLILSGSPLIDRRPFLDIVKERLVAANIPVVNLTPRFIEEAKALLDRNEYIYWTDDTHWNAAGISDAAQALSESDFVTQLPCRSR